MALVIRQIAAPNLGVNSDGLGVALDLQPAVGAAQTVSLTFGSKVYFKHHLSCSGT